MQKTGTARHPGAILGVMAFAGIVASLTQTLVVPLRKRRRSQQRRPKTEPQGAENPPQRSEGQITAYRRVDRLAARRWALLPG
ncbi:hypothetical protein [Nocardia wallacei]|uniref:hypothetical protein n=1 Tax=Nocardia wallacei TaxID=480035 RepID=UPI002458AC6E|nr:hypothetical protein [Nocardia wallacei]